MMVVIFLSIKKRYEKIFKECSKQIELTVDQCRSDVDYVAFKEIDTKPSYIMYLEKEILRQHRDKKLINRKYRVRICKRLHDIKMQVYIQSKIDRKVEMTTK